jgi:hypothetical protein
MFTGRSGPKGEVAISTGVSPASRTASIAAAMNERSSGKSLNSDVWLMNTRLGATARPPDHIHRAAIYIGSDQMITAPGERQVVKIAPYRWTGDDYFGATRP